MALDAEFSDRSSRYRSQRDGRPSTLFVRLAADIVSAKVVGFVVTFDDITELVAAQRKAAWSDVARRIAHEIKNPLTPITSASLAAKYLSEITTDPDTILELYRYHHPPGRRHWAHG